MIPIRIQGRPGGRPWVTWAFAILCAAAMVRLVTLPDARALAALNSLAIVPARFLAAPASPEQLVTLLTSAFLHAGWVHLAGNMLYLAVFGPTVEGRLGHAKFFALYSATGAIAGLTHTLANPASTTPLVGASGAIAGVLGASLVLAPRARVTTLIPVVVFIEIAELPAAFVVTMWFALQVASAFAPIAAGASESVAWYAHVGGFIAGAALAAAWESRRLPVKRTQPRRSRGRKNLRRAD